VDRNQLCRHRAGQTFRSSVIRCTKEQFLAEVKAQIMSCQSLNALVKEANDGRDLADFKIAAIEVWHEWIFSAEGIRGQPKWVTTTNTQPYLPRQITPVPNLLLAGAHTRTEVTCGALKAQWKAGEERRRR